MRGDTGNQQPSDPADRMYIAQRAHGNAAEYVPTLIGLLIVCSVLTDGWWLDALSIAAVVVRLLHAVGMLTSKTLAGHGPVRDIGAMGTYAGRDRARRHGHRLAVNAGPVVGIVGHGYVVPKSFGDLPVVGTPADYAERLVAAGARPVLLPGATAVDLLDVVDALVLTGGGDVDPRLYGGPPDGAVDVDPARDDAEIALVRAAAAPGSRSSACAADSRSSPSPSAAP